MPAWFCWEGVGRIAGRMCAGFGGARDRVRRPAARHHMLPPPLMHRPAHAPAHAPADAPAHAPTPARRPQNLKFARAIRYESRKQLAQQRPRVRGQFVKHTGGNNSHSGSAAGPGRWERGGGKGQLLLLAGGKKGVLKQGASLCSHPTWLRLPTALSLGPFPSLAAPAAWTRARAPSLGPSRLTHTLPRTVASPHLPPCPSNALQWRRRGRIQPSTEPGPQRRQRRGRALLGG